MDTRQFHSSPPKPTPRGYTPYSANPIPLAKARKQHLRENMQGYFLGPMDPGEFMRSFMPVNSSDLGHPPNKIDFSLVYDQPNERLMYEPFIEIANATCTNFVAKFTGDRADADASLKPDVTLFSKNNPVALCEDFGKPSPATSFQNMELFVEFKHNTQHDPFQDETSNAAAAFTVERDSNNGDNTRGQCALYAANQLAYQHRVFAFSLVVCGERARFIRWDREGAVVSAGIDCSKDHNLVIEFLQRFDQMTPEQRGLDPTATPATPGEIEAFRYAITNVGAESLKLSVGNQATYPRYRLEIRDAGGEVSHYIVGKALDYNLGVVGRCTRGYLALDLSTNQPVFIKDMWRPDVLGIEPEHVWYEKLTAANVPYLVKVKHGSDVIQPAPTSNYHGTVPLKPTETTSRQGAQRGLTSRLAGLFGSDGPGLQGRVHYRLVQTELCRPLSEFKNSKQLVLVVLHSLKACKSTFVDAGLFHRDVSLGNIMIGHDDEGRLNDWDLCRGVSVDESLEGPRTGTWQFISTKLLEFPGSGHTLTDDLESHFFVLMWVALHWVKHDKAGKIDMEFIFDQQRPLEHGIIGGGVGKSEMYKTEQKELRGVEFSCEPFEKLFWSLWKLFSEYNRQRWAETGGQKGGLDLNAVAGSSVDSTPKPKSSVSPDVMIRLFEAALELPGWTNDKVADQFPRAGGVTSSRTTLSKVETVDSGADPKPAKRQRASKSAGADLEYGVSAKRAKLE